MALKRDSIADSEIALCQETEFNELKFKSTCARVGVQILNPA